MKVTTINQLENSIERLSNVIDDTYVKKSDNISVDLSAYQTTAQADAKYLEKTALNIISAVPSQSGSITYDGTSKTPSWLNYDSSKLQISGDFQNKTNAGTYPVSFKPISPCTWADGTQDTKNATWNIGKATGSLSLSAETGSVNIDSTKTFTVNRAGDGAITVTSSNSNVATVSVSGNTVTITGNAAGSATITVKVAAGTNHFAPADKTFAVTVTKIPLNLSASISGTVTYNLTGTINISGNLGGGAVTATSANSSCVTVSSTTTNTATIKCSNYNATATQININVAETTKYASGTCTCAITTAKADGDVTLSSYEGTATYGSPITFNVKTNLSGGTLSAISSDSNYVTSLLNGSTVTVTPVNCSQPYQTITVKSAETINYKEATATYNVTLDKAIGTPTLSASSVTLTSSSPPATVTLTSTRTGTISATPAHTSICTASVNNKTITISAIGRGTTYVTVNIAEDDNYKTSSQTISVDATNAAVNLLAGKEGNYGALGGIAGIASQVLKTNYCKPGDYFDITFPTEIPLDDDYSIPANSTWRAVCLGIKHNLPMEYYAGGATAHFGIFKNTDNVNICFWGKKMNSEATNAGGWNSSELKTWLNDTFYNALPSALRGVLANARKYTDNTGNKSDTAENVTMTTQHIWLMSEYEIIGDYDISPTSAIRQQLSNPYESDSQEQYEYFKNGNQASFSKHNDLFSNKPSVWLRSPVAKNDTDFTCVSNAGGRTSAPANIIRGFIPCFCIT